MAAVPDTVIACAAAAATTARAATAAGAAVSANVHPRMGECMNEGFEPDARLGSAPPLAAVAAAQIH